MPPFPSSRAAAKLALTRATLTAVAWLLALVWLLVLETLVFKRDGLDDDDEDSEREASRSACAETDGSDASARIWRSLRSRMRRVDGATCVRLSCSAAAEDGDIRRSARETVASGATDLSAFAADVEPLALEEVADVTAAAEPEAEPDTAAAVEAAAAPAAAPSPFERAR